MGELRADPTPLLAARAGSASAVMARAGVAHRHAKELEVLAGQLRAMPLVAEAHAQGRITTEAARIVGGACLLPGFRAAEPQLLRAAESGSLRHTRREVTRFQVRPAEPDEVPEADRPSTVSLRRRGQWWVLSGDLSLLDGEALDVELRRCARASQHRHERNRADATPDLEVPQPVLVEPPLDGEPDDHDCADDCECRLDLGDELSAVGRGTPWGERIGAALLDVVRRSIALGDRGAGTRPEVVVHARLDEGDPELHDPRLVDGTAISRAAFARICQDADLRRALIGPRSEPMELGRSARCASEGQRRMLEIRDGGCLGQGCDAPPGMCRVHHRRHSERLGPTDLDNLELRCDRCHADAHRLGLTFSDLGGDRGLACFRADGTLLGAQLVAPHLRERLNRQAD